MILEYIAPRKIHIVFINFIKIHNIYLSTEQIKIIIFKKLTHSLECLKTHIDFITFNTYLCVEQNSTLRLLFLKHSKTKSQQIKNHFTHLFLIG